LNATREGGFTIIEVVVAIIVLTIGVLGLASTAATVTRMVAQGQRYSNATTLAAQRFEILRSTACASMVDGSSTSGTYSVAWTVAASGTGKEVTVIVTSPKTGGTRADTVSSYITCTA